MLGASVSKMMAGRTLPWTSSAEDGPLDRELHAGRSCPSPAHHLRPGSWHVPASGELCAHLLNDHTGFTALKPCSPWGRLVPQGLQNEQKLCMWP